jgi:hypothetical protein
VKRNIRVKKPRTPASASPTCIILSVPKPVCRHTCSEHILCSIPMHTALSFKVGNLSPKVSQALLYSTPLASLSAIPKPTYIIFAYRIHISPYIYATRFGVAGSVITIYFFFTRPVQISPSFLPRHYYAADSITNH